MRHIVSKICLALVLGFGFTLVQLGIISVKGVDGPVVRATNYTVCSVGPPTCTFTSIQAAIDVADNGDTILIATGTYTENVTINKNLILQGEGLDIPIVDGNGLDHVFTVQAGVIVNIIGMAITNGRASSGAGIENDGTLILDDAIVEDNVAVGGIGGGGIRNTGVMTLNNTIIRSNSAPGGEGGGIRNEGTLTLNNSTINSNSCGNSGGGITNKTMYSVNAVLVLNNSTVSGNTANTFGAGIANGRISGFGNPLIRLSNTTIVDNIVASGGFSSGGGIYSAGFGVINIKNSIIAGNSADDWPNCYNISSSTLASLGYNLEDNNTCNFSAALGDIINTNPLLGPLQDNGGSTPTHAIIPPSLAINGGNPTGCTNGNDTPLSSDQRGKPRSQGIHCDIGAYEAQVELSLTKTVDNNLPIRGQLISYTLTISNSGVLTGTNLLVSDTLPISLTFAGPLRLFPLNVILPSPISPILANDLTLAPSQQISLTFLVTVNSQVAEGTLITNTASVTSLEVITPVTNEIRIKVAHTSNLPLLLKN